MMALWHPHTERPKRICSCLLANQPTRDDDCWALEPGNYVYRPATDEFRNEDDGALVVLPAFFWAAESDVLHELENGSVQR